MQSHESLVARSSSGSSRRPTASPRPCGSTTYRSEAGHGAGPAKRSRACRCKQARAHRPGRDSRDTWSSPRRGPLQLVVENTDRVEHRPIFEDDLDPYEPEDPSRPAASRDAADLPAPGRPTASWSPPQRSFQSVPVASGLSPQGCLARLAPFPPHTSNDIPRH